MKPKKPPPEPAMADTGDPWKRPPNNPKGNPGYHPSTKAYEHAGSKHSSKDR